MSESEIVEQMSRHQGQSQLDRPSAELAEGFAPIDLKTPAELLIQAGKLAELFRYYLPSGAESGDWSDFFAAITPETALALLNSPEGELTPHLALLGAFYELFTRYPLEHLNRLPGRHLDFFYEQVLRFERRPFIPPRAHLLVELKKGSAPQLITPEAVFAGKDAKGTAITFSPTGETVLSAARIGSVRSIYRDGAGPGTIRFASQANSADGFGAPLGPAGTWAPFGGPSLPAAQVGFALASPVLKMAQGSRTVTVILSLDGMDPIALPPGQIAASLSVYLTGPKSWLGPFEPTATVAAGSIRLQATMPPDRPGVVNHESKVHITSFPDGVPVAQVLLRPGGLLGYDDFARLTVNTAQLEVEVEGITDLEIENDTGPLNPKKTFLPFGPRPQAGSRFIVNSPEVFSKKLLKLELKIAWQAAPSNFATHYKDYPVTINDSFFTADVDFRDGGSWLHSSSAALFSPRSGGVRTLSFASAGSEAPPAASGEATDVYALNKSGRSWAKRQAHRKVQEKEVLKPHLRTPPALQPGHLVLTFEQPAVDELYRKRTVSNLMAFARDTSASAQLTQLNEPYVPAAGSVSIGYRAHSDRLLVNLPTLSAFTQTDLQFFHVGVFGQMEEHAYQRNQFAFLGDQSISLLPRHESEGEIHLGIAQLEPGASVSVLFQCASGTADPDLNAQKLSWAVLCDNYFRTLTQSEVFGDNTAGLRSSGVITFVVPKEATAGNSIMPPGYVWIRGSMAQQVGSACRLVAVGANAVEVVLTNPDPPAGMLNTPQPAGSITKLQIPLPLVKSISQPFSTFAGAPAEEATSLRTRASERLRHKGRAVTGWDWERLLLEAFPQVHRVKCIPHSRENAWLAPGNVLVIVVPDLRNHNAMDPLRPKVDAQTISQMDDFLSRRAALGASFKVRNPIYQRVRFEMKVRLMPGKEFNFYSDRLNRELIDYLSPWAFDAARPLAFGARLYKSVVLDFIERLPYIDYITDLKMTMPDAGSTDLTEAAARRPDEILVSDYSHLVGEAL